MMGAARPARVPSPEVRPIRTVTALALLVALEALAVRTTIDAWQVVTAPAPASLAEAVLTVVLAASVLLGAWLLLGTTVAVAAHLPGRLGAPPRRWAATWAPALSRRAAAVLVGAALGTGAAAPGLAADGQHPSEGPGFAVTRAVVAATVPRLPPVAESPAPDTEGSAPGPGWTPTRPVHPPARGARLVTGAGTRVSSEVVVHRGDSLWGIVRRQLGPGATDAEVAAAWPHWYAANRSVVGPDPDVLLSGQVLRAPEQVAQAPR